MLSSWFTRLSEVCRKFDHRPFSSPKIRYRARCSSMRRAFGSMKYITKAEVRLNYSLATVLVIDNFLCSSHKTTTNCFLNILLSRQHLGPGVTTVPRHTPIVFRGNTLVLRTPHRRKIFPTLYLVDPSLRIWRM
jgi:hypothetical protein